MPHVVLLPQRRKQAWQDFWVLKAVHSPLRSPALTHISGDEEAASFGSGGGVGAQEQEMSMQPAQAGCRQPRWHHVVLEMPVREKTACGGPLGPCWNAACLLCRVPP